MFFRFCSSNFDRLNHDQKLNFVSVIVGFLLATTWHDLLSRWTMPYLKTEKNKIKIEHTDHVC